MSSRDGNTLSNVMRDAWDGKPLRVMARSNKNSCAHPHISLIGNITIEELQRLLTTTDQSNGFANRILWCCARRSKKLPYGGNKPDAAQMDALVKALREALTVASLGSSTSQTWEPSFRVITFDAEAHGWWSKAYDRLEDTQASGAFGKVTARASAHVVRLATLYALLDCSQHINIQHLNAAMEVWRYCEDSARFIFGNATGNDTVDRIAKAISNGPSVGLTTTEISNLFGRNKSAHDLSQALATLEQQQKIRRAVEPTLGRAVTRWCRV